MRTGYIYSLADPKSGFVRYVGQTIVKPSSRYAQHIYQWKRCDVLSHVNAWIKHLSLSNLKPVLEVVVDSIPEKELDTKEIEIIKLFKACGAILCNHTPGGSGNGTKGYKQTDEAKLKRLLSLSTSVAWKEKHERHSLIMKEKWKNGLMKPLYETQSLEQQLQSNKLRSTNNPRRRILKILVKETGKIITFPGMINFANYLGYKHESSVYDFVYNKRKSKHSKKYHLLENTTASELAAKRKLKADKAKKKK